MPAEPAIAIRARRDVESMLESPRPDGGGLRMVAAVLMPSDAGVLKRVRRFVGASGLLGGDEAGLLVVRHAASETEGWVWAQGLGGIVKSPVGLCVPANSGDAAARAAAALELALARGGEHVCSAGMVELLREARAVAAEVGLDSAGRRMRLLRRVIFRLGSAQAEHITGHCEQVARTTARLAQLMGLDEERIAGARLAGLLHDLGKAVFPEELLAKRQGLSSGERELLARHTFESAEIARALGVEEEVCRAVAGHHDRFDAAGVGGATAGIVCVADALVTMTTHRAYSPARTFTEALAELRRGRGTLFDPGAVVAAHLFGASAMALAA